VRKEKGDFLGTNKNRARVMASIVELKLVASATLVALSLKMQTNAKFKEMLVADESKEAIMGKAKRFCAKKAWLKMSAIEAGKMPMA